MRSRRPSRSSTRHPRKSRAGAEGISTFEQEWPLALINSLPDDVFFVNAEGEIVFANDAVRQSLGLSAKEDVLGVLSAIEQRFQVLKPDGTPRTPEESPFVPALRGEFVRGEEIVRHRRTGERRHRSYQVVPVVSAGKIVGAVSLVRDITERKRAEETLRESEERFRTLFDHMSEGFFLAEVICGEAGQPVDYRYLNANAAFGPLTGLDPRAIVGKTVRQTLPGVEDAWIQLYGRVALTGEAATIDGFAAPLGRLYDTVAYCPKPGQFACLFRDVTERKRSEAALRESERRLREIFESMAEAYCVIEMIFDENGGAVDFRYLETNPAFVKHATQPMLGKRIKEIVPDVEPFWLDQYGRVAVTGEPVELEHVVAGLGDQWFHTSAFRIGGEDSRRVGVVFENITERKRAEEAREASRHQLQAIIDNTPAIVYAFDLDHRFVMANAAVAQVLNSTPRQLIGKRRHEFMPRQDADWHEANDRQVSEAGTALEFEESSELRAARSHGSRRSSRYATRREGYPRSPESPLTSPSASVPRRCCGKARSGSASPKSFRPMVS